MQRLLAIVPLLGLLPALASRPAAAAAAEPSAYFGIQVIDEQTGRGVPLVELRTVNHLRYVTDSAGWVAFNEPGLMGREVFFHISSHGYEYPKDGFGFRGARLTPEAGKTATVKLKRLNVAERLYRVTGQGIYRDSLLLGLPTPIKQPALNAQVLGQDSVQTAIYQGKLFWFWGDTNKASYPLGHFGMAGATSALPGKGGLAPSVGVDLAYFAGEDGFSRPTAGELSRDGLKWLDGVCVIPDETGKPRLVARYAVMKSLDERTQQGVVAWDDASESFKLLKRFPNDHPMGPTALAFEHEVGGTKYIYFAAGYPLMRVKADWASFQDPDAYEGYTALAPGERFAGDRTKLERDAAGKLVRGWKRNTPPLTHDQEDRLIKPGILKDEERFHRMADADGGKPIRMHNGSVRWNASRKKFVMIANREHGDGSYLGDVYYAEADAPEGPWLKAKKVVTHDKYSFYNPNHHAFFDEEGGRVIYFEGTYTHTFSRKGNEDVTPRYDYNQVMYRLDLGDPRMR